MTLPQLSNTELSIMELIWQLGPLTARAIQEELYPGAKKSKHGTVQSLLQRLEEKGFVSRDRSVGINIFSALFSREFYVSRQLESLTERLTGGSLAPVVTHLLQEKRLSIEEIERLRRILDEYNTEEDD